MLQINHWQCACVYTCDDVCEMGRKRMKDDAGTKKVDRVCVGLLHD